MNLETIRLISAALDGTLSHKDFDTLQEILRSDHVAFELYCEQSEMAGRLLWELPGAAAPEQTTKTTPFSALKYLGAAAAIAVSTALVGYAILRQPETAIADSEPPQTQPTLKISRFSSTSSLARITNTKDAIWQDDSLQVGSWLKSGKLRLLSGEAEITFDSGARIILNGPSELESFGPHLARLNSGKGVIHIPSQAEGFQLQTPTNTFADPECSFALAVDSDATEIHVLQGSVGASPVDRASESATLLANESMRLTKDSVLSNDLLRYAATLFYSELPASDSSQKSEFLRWSFDSMQNGTFPESGNHSQANYPAKIQQLARMPEEAASQTVKGPFGRAVRFDGNGGYLATTFPGIPGVTERTVACWVRIAKNEKASHAYSLFSWGEPNSQTGTKWQIAWNAAYENSGTYGALRTEFGGGYVIGSTNLLDGQWHHIASVYLGGNSSDVTAQVMHYVDGRLESVSAHKQKKINTEIVDNHTRHAFIGKRLEDDLDFTSFKGDIDELHVFPAALTPAQIENLRLHNQTPKTLLKNLALHSKESDE